MKYLTALLLLLLLSAWPGRARAVNCPVTGTITTDCSWASSSSPVSLGGVTVASGVTATVEPGVVILMSTADMDIYGALTVNDSASIVATSDVNDADIRVHPTGVFDISGAASVIFTSSGRINVDINGATSLSGPSLDVNTFTCHPGATCSLINTTMNAGKIAFYKGSNYTLSGGNTLRGGVYPDTDGDGIPDDGDRSGVIGDNPCTGGNTANCDDNCSRTTNPGQQDTDNDNYGNACDCDLDNNGNVGVSDFNIFKAAWFSNSSSPNWNPDADFDSNGNVGVSDFNIFKSRWFTTGPWN